MPPSPHTMHATGFWGLDPHKETLLPRLQDWAHPIRVQESFGPMPEGSKTLYMDDIGENQSCVARLSTTTMTTQD